MRESPPFVRAVLLALGASLLGGGGLAAETLRRSAPLMSTEVEVTLQGPDRRALETASDDVFNEFRRIERIASEWTPESEVSRVNALAGVAPAAVGADLRAMLERGERIRRATEGKFDVTWAVLRGFWNFGPEQVHRVPSRSDLAPLLKRIDGSKVRIDEASGTVFLPERGMKLGLGGLAKGYAVARSIEILERDGIRSGIVNAGGNMYVLGRKEDGPWRIGIRDPRDPQGVLGTVEVENRFLSTSGDYEHYFLLGGVRYHHEIDPATGFPAMESRAMTVLAEDPTWADGLSTGLFILGPRRGRKAIAKLQGVEGLWVDARGRIVMTEGFRKLFRPAGKERP